MPSRNGKYGKYGSHNDVRVRPCPSVSVRVVVFAMLTAGIDAGSRAIKIVLFDHERGTMRARGVVDQGIAQEQLANELLQRLLRDEGVASGELARVVATGYARNNISLAATTITEITCHAAGVHYLAPEAMTVVEIGGQDSKLLRLSAGGAVRDFAMNDRCAAGTGCFLEMVARRLDSELTALGTLAARSEKPALISSTCVVFAETEIIGLLVGGVAPADIVAGVQAAVATRITAMTGGKLTPPVVFTGGVALIPGMCAALENALGYPVTAVSHPQFTGALGAAILAGRDFGR